MFIILQMNYFLKEIFATYELNSQILLTASIGIRNFHWKKKLGTLYLYVIRSYTLLRMCTSRVKAKHPYSIQLQLIKFFFNKQDVHIIN